MSPLSQYIARDTNELHTNKLTSFSEKIFPLVQIVCHRNTTDSMSHNYANPYFSRVSVLCACPDRRSTHTRKEPRVGVERHSLVSDHAVKELLSST